MHSMQDPSAGASPAPGAAASACSPTLMTGCSAPRLGPQYCRHSSWADHVCRCAVPVTESGRTELASLMVEHIDDQRRCSGKSELLSCVLEAVAEQEWLATAQPA